MRLFYIVRKSLFFFVLAGSFDCAMAGTTLPQSIDIASTSSEIELQPIVVTSQKREQPIEDVSISISVVDQDDLKNTSANRLVDMQQLVPNFSVVQYGVSDAISIRGIGGGGRNIGFDTRAGVYLDGIYMGQVPALESPLLEIEQIEVLRGPQGYLFGRNTVAGAVNITTREPSESFEAYYRTGIGNYNFRENFAGVSGPITENLKGKFAIGAEFRDGFVTNEFNNSAIRDLNRFAARGQLSYQANDQLKIDLSADYAKIKQSDFEGVAVTGLFDAPLPSGPNPNNKVNFNIAPSVKTSLSGASLTANYDMLSGHKLTAITGYRTTNGKERSDNDYTSVDLISTRFIDDYKQTTQEIRIASPLKDSFRYVAGIFLLHESSNSNRSATFGSDTSTLIKLPTIPFSVPFDAVFGVAPGANIPTSGSVKTNSYALFGSAEYDVTDKITLNLGARYTYETKDLIYNSDGTQSAAFGFATVSNYRDHRQDNDLSPMVGMSYALNKNLNFYGKYSNGFKSGGWNVDFLTAAQINNGFAFNKETVDSYELGLKGNALNHRMQYDLSVFLGKYKDFQVFQFVDLGAGQTIIQLRNAAKAESKGAEASIRALVTDHLNVGANIGLLDAKYLAFPGGGAGGSDAAGQRLPDAPELTAAITCNYTLLAPSLNGKFDFYGESTYRSKSYSGINNDQSISGLSSRNIVNTRISYITNNHHWELSAWARNLFDKSYTTARGKDFFGNQFVRYGDPLLLGLEAQYNF